MFQLFPTTNTTLVYSLIPYTAYTCVIAAETAVGVGPFSAAYVVMTSADGEIYSNVESIIPLSSVGKWWDLHTDSNIFVISCSSHVL